MAHPVMAMLTRLPRTPYIARMTTSLGVPDAGPETASRPTRNQNRLPTTITASACHSARPSSTRLAPTTRLR
nr:hypothetical protein [Saccharopolyspora erythraea]